MSQDVAVLDKNPVSAQTPNNGTQTPVGSLGHKENEPVKIPAAEAYAAEYIKSSESEPRINQDLKDLGVEAKKDAQIDESVGISEHIKQFTPVSTPSSGGIKMLMSEEEIKKASGQNNSRAWLADLLKKIMKGIRKVKF